MAERKITVLVENTASGHGLLGEHGLSFWIELGENKILFDTGQGQALKHNAQRLRLKIESVSSILLSHGHYDHTGGLSDVLALADRPRVYAHPQAFAPKYACNPDGSARYIGFPNMNEEDVRAKANLILVEKPTEILGGLWLTGPIPRTNVYEDTGGRFFEDKDCRQPDYLLDDQAAFFETKTGTVVILGCAHAGIINTLNLIQTLTLNKPIRAVIGGMHLLNASPERMNMTVTELHRLKVQRLMPCHCTGLAAVARLWHEFPGQCEASYVGSFFQFED